MMQWIFTFLLLIGMNANLHASGLTVQLQTPKQTGSKVVVKLMLKNAFKEKIESARATVFLSDDQSKMVAQETRWIIGGSKDRPALEPEKEAVFNFVVDTSKPFKKAQVVVTRLILEGGRSVEIKGNVEVQP